MLSLTPKYFQIPNRTLVLPLRYAAHWNWICRRVLPPSDSLDYNSSVPVVLYVPAVDIWAFVSFLVSLLLRFGLIPSAGVLQEIVVFKFSFFFDTSSISLSVRGY